MNTTKLSKLIKIFKNQYFIVTIITIAGLFIRLINIDKPVELWRDEVLTYVFSSKSFPFGILKALWLEDYHMPFYYFYMHGWMHLFGTSNLALKLSSVIWGVLTIPACFYLGKTYRSKSLGYLIATFACLSPILIYYSQEVRFYSLLVFLSTLSITFFLKLLDNPSSKNFWLFGISNLLILYVYTMGIIFVAAEFVILLVHIYLYKKEKLKQIIKNSIIFSMLALPYFLLLFAYIYKSNQAIIEPFSWGIINHKFLLLLLNNWFSPNLYHILNNGMTLNRLMFFKDNVLNYFIFFSGVSISCFVIGFIASLENLKRKKLYLLIILLSFLLAEVYLYFKGNLALVVRYTMIIYPILLLICCDGFLSFKRLPFRIIPIALITIIFLYNIVNCQYMFTFRVREYMFINHSFVFEMMNLKVNKNDYILHTEHNYLLGKYLPKTSFIDLNIANLQQPRLNPEIGILFFDKEFIKTTNKKNSAEKLAPFFLNPNPKPELYSFFNKIIDKIPVGNHIILVDETGALKKNFSNVIWLVKEAENNKETNILYKNELYTLLQTKVLNNITKVLESNKYIKKTGERSFRSCEYVVYTKIKAKNGK